MCHLYLPLLLVVLLILVRQCCSCWWNERASTCCRCFSSPLSFLSLSLAFLLPPHLSPIPRLLPLPPPTAGPLAAPMAMPPCAKRKAAMASFALSATCPLLIAQATTFSWPPCSTVLPSWMQPFSSSVRYPLPLCFSLSFFLCVCVCVCVVCVSLCVCVYVVCVCVDVTMCICTVVASPIADSTNPSFFHSLVFFCCLY